MKSETLNLRSSAFICGFFIRVIRQASALKNRMLLWEPIGAELEDVDAGALFCLSKKCRYKI